MKYNLQFLFKLADSFENKLNKLAGTFTAEQTFKKFSPEEQNIIMSEFEKYVSEFDKLDAAGKLEPLKEITGPVARFSVYDYFLSFKSFNNIIRKQPAFLGNAYAAAKGLRTKVGKLPNASDFDALLSALDTITTLAYRRYKRWEFANRPEGVGVPVMRSKQSPTIETNKALEAEKLRREMLKKQLEEELDEPEEE